MRPLFFALAALLLTAAQTNAGFVVSLQVTDGVSAYPGITLDGGQTYIVDLPDGSQIKGIADYYLPRSLGIFGSLVLPAVPVGKSYDIEFTIRYTAESPYGQQPFPAPGGADNWFGTYTYFSGDTKGSPGISGTVSSSIDSWSTDKLSVTKPWVLSDYALTGRTSSSVYAQSWNVHLDGGFKGATLSAGSAFYTPAPPAAVLVLSALPFFALRRLRLR
ncbi:unnamed protein product [Gemmata massiliana]|uniref:Uncharacterized protein n=1 Tax=Gemmata massiliana TaxID=1210884 RepID=A0A6P2CYC5_9BACT|nr:hypothetical protein [Gemmata massiliana]VTR92132.1 unnamed protein product [Gemmata massiliana]